MQDDIHDKRILVSTLAKVCSKERLARDAEVLNLYLIQLEAFPVEDLRTVVETFQGSKMPTPYDLKQAVMREQSRRMVFSGRSLLPAPDEQIWVCPACMNTGWVKTFQDGNQAVRRCLVGGYHSLRDRLEEVEASGKQDLINWILTTVKRRGTMDAFDSWMTDAYGTTYLSALTTKELWKIRKEFK